MILIRPTVDDLREQSEKVDEVAIFPQILSIHGLQHAFGTVGACLSAISVSDNLMMHVSSGFCPRMMGRTVSHSVNFGSSAMTSSAACFIAFWTV